MTNGIIFDIKRFAVNDGPGIRTTVFLKGCPLGCSWCHNPEGRDPLPQQQISRNNPDEQETVGREIDSGNLLAELVRDRMFYEQSGGGVTFSGGEPLLQPQFLAELLRGCREQGIHTAVDTCGHVAPMSIRAAASLADLFLYDLKLASTKDHKLHTGVGNEQILANLRYLSKAGSRLVIRFPVIPGITDTEANIDGILTITRGVQNVVGVQVLPFHRMAGGKCERLGIQDPAEQIPDADLKRVEEITRRFLAAGYKVNQGGH